MIRSNLSWIFITRFISTIIVCLTVSYHVPNGGHLVTRCQLLKIFWSGNIPTTKTRYVMWIWPDLWNMILLSRNPWLINVMKWAVHDTVPAPQLHLTSIIVPSKYWDRVRVGHRGTMMDLTTTEQKPSFLVSLWLSDDDDHCSDNRASEVPLHRQVTSRHPEYFITSWRISHPTVSQSSYSSLPWIYSNLLKQDWDL